jgi:hypothetical protein
MTVECLGSRMTYAKHPPSYGPIAPMFASRINPMAASPWRRILREHLYMSSQSRICGHKPMLARRPRSAHGLRNIPGIPQAPTFRVLQQRQNGLAGTQKFRGGTASQEKLYGPGTGRHSKSGGPDPHRLLAIGRHNPTTFAGSARLRVRLAPTPSCTATTPGLPKPAE